MKVGRNDDLIANISPEVLSCHVIILFKQQVLGYFVVICALSESKQNGRKTMIAISGVVGSGG